MESKKIDKNAIKDKRKITREDKIENIYFSHFNEDGSLNIQGEGISVDFSPMGMQIRVEYELPINTKILIEIFLDEEIQRYTGEIAWVNKMEGEERFSAGIRILFKKVIYRANG